MFPKIDPAATAAWKALQEHYTSVKDKRIAELFGKGNNRFASFSQQAEDILFDYSKNYVSETTMQLLLQLADECRLKEAIAAMFNGEKINETENRAVLHIALRSFSGEIQVDGKDIMSDVKAVREKMK